MPGLLAKNEWCFNLQDACYSDDDGDKPEDVNHEAHYLKAFDLASREDTANFKPNPWSIAKANAACRSKPLSLPQNIQNTKSKPPKQTTLTKAFSKHTSKSRSTPSYNGMSRHGTSFKRDSLPYQRQSTRELPQRGFADSSDSEHQISDCNLSFHAHTMTQSDTALQFAYPRGQHTRTDGQDIESDSTFDHVMLQKASDYPLEPQLTSIPGASELTEHPGTTKPPQISPPSPERSCFHTVNYPLRPSILVQKQHQASTLSSFPTSRGNSHSICSPPRFAHSPPPDNSGPVRLTSDSLLEHDTLTDDFTSTDSIVTAREPSELVTQSDHTFPEMTLASNFSRRRSIHAGCPESAFIRSMRSSTEHSRPMDSKFGQSLLPMAERTSTNSNEDDVWSTFPRRQRGRWKQPSVKTSGKFTLPIALPRPSDVPIREARRLVTYKPPSIHPRDEDIPILRVVKYKKQDVAVVKATPGRWNSNIELQSCPENMHCDDLLVTSSSPLSSPSPRV